MLARVLVLLLGLLGGLSSGALGANWLMASLKHTDTLRNLPNASDAKVQTGLARLDGMTRAAYGLLAACPLGLLGGILGGKGKKWLAALLLLLAVPGPLLFSYWTVVPASCLVMAAFLALFIRRPRHPSEQGIGGCWNAVKGWLNIGGVKVRFDNVDPNVSKNSALLAGKVKLTAKSDRHVHGIYYKLMMKRSSGRGEDKESKDNVLGETGQQLDLDLKKGETQVLDFQVPFTFKKGLKDMGGVLGGVGKLAAFAMAEKDECYLIAEAEVEGCLFEATDQLKMKLVD